MSTQFHLAQFLFAIQLTLSPIFFVEPVSADDPTEERLSRFAYIQSADDARDFISRLQELVAKHDRAGLVALVRFPFTNYVTPGKPRRIYKTQAEFLKDFDRIFTNKVLSAVREAKYEDIFVNYQGAMFGNGTIWFSQSDGTIKIKAING